MIEQKLRKKNILYWETLYNTLYLTCLSLKYGIQNSKYSDQTQEKRVYKGEYSVLK